MKLHRFWAGPENRAANVWLDATVKETHPNLEIVDWMFDDLPKRLRTQLNPTEDPRHISNLARYWLLYTEGGLWMDHDVIPFTDLTEVHDEPWTASLYGRREGAVLYFPTPGHQMCADAFNFTLEKKRPSLERFTGAEILHSVGEKYPEVIFEPRVFPFDSNGIPTKIEDPLAIHLWITSSSRLMFNQRTQFSRYSEG